MIRERELHGMHHDVAVRAAVAPEDLVGQQLCARSNADDLAVGCVPAPIGGSDPRDVRAVCGIGSAGAEDLGAVRVIGVAGKRIAVRLRNRMEGGARGRVVGVADEVEPAAHLAPGPEAAAELGQRVVETAVHDRDRHA